MRVFELVLRRMRGSDGQVTVIYMEAPIPVVARSKAWDCGRSLAGIVGSNPAVGMAVCLLRVLCFIR